MPDYTMKQTKQKDGTTKLEMDVSPELKELFGKGKFEPPTMPKPEIVTFDENTRKELDDIVDDCKANVRAKFIGMPVTYIKLVLRQLWLEFKDLPEIDYGNPNIPIKIPATTIKREDDLG